MPTTDTSQPISTPSATDDKYAASTWLNGGIGGAEDLQVPSGQLCLVRRPGVQGLITAGVLQKMDSLSALVGEKHLKGRKKSKSGNPAKRAAQEAANPDEIDISSLIQDEKVLEDVLHTVDRVVTYCVLKPEIRMTPNDVTNRKPGVVYADMVDIVDKMFIFNFVVGGTRDIERFRGELEDAVGGVAASEGVPKDA